MLFKQVHLDGIKAGTIHLAFRKWKKPTVKTGSVLNTSIGQVKVISLDSIDQNDITEEDARNAGFTNLNDLLELLDKNHGTTYRIGIAYHKEDPRIALRSDDSLSEVDFTLLMEKLERLDTYSKQGNWTRSTLEVIKSNPGLRAADLAKITGREKEWLKTNIRKLKNLGLTISHEIGYSISPRGAEFLRSAEKSQSKGK